MQNMQVFAVDLGRLTLRVAAAAEDVYFVGLAFTVRAAVFTVWPSVAITARMSAFVFLFGVHSCPESSSLRAIPS
jgi:hypothetical protein